MVTLVAFADLLALALAPILEYCETEEDVLAEQPAVRGDELFIGEDLEELLEAAERARQRWGSRLIDVPHVLLALGRDRRIGAELFAGLGLPADRLEAQLRQPVTPASPNPRPASS